MSFHSQLKDYAFLLMITAVSDARTDRGIVTVSGRTIMDDSNDENEVCTCEAETEC
jgi:hypothetical protein